MPAAGEPFGRAEKRFSGVSEEDWTDDDKDAGEPMLVGGEDDYSSV